MLPTQQFPDARSQKLRHALFYDRKQSILSSIADRFTQHFKKNLTVCVYLVCAIMLHSPFRGCYYTSFLTNFLPA